MSNCTDYDVRLVDGPAPNRGKIMACVNGVWGTLCDNHISTNDANVICRQLGYKAEGMEHSMLTM